MEPQRAREILLTYRLGEAATPGSELATALALAERNPELRLWREQELRFDHAIRAQLRATPVPSDLRAAILRGRSRAEPRRRWLPPVALALAAALALTLGLTLLRPVFRTPVGVAALPSAKPTTPLSLDQFRLEMASRLAEGLYSLQAQSESLGELRRFLAQNQGAADAAVPSSLSALKTYGCQVFDWNGQRVTLICFTSPKLGIVHLLVFDAGNLGVKTGPAQLASAAGWNTAAWRRGDRAYLLYAHAPIASLRAMAGS